MGSAGLHFAGVDDGPVPRARGARVFVAIPVVRGSGLLEGLLTTHVRRDGWNATDRVAGVIRSSRFWPQLHGVFLDGIALGGLNVVDLPRLAETLERPVIAVMRRPPRLEAFRAAVARLPRPAARWALVERAGPILRAERVLFQCAGVVPERARRWVEETARWGNLPEPLRMAHLIAGGVVDGESRGRA